LYFKQFRTLKKLPKNSLLGKSLLDNPAGHRITKFLRLLSDCALIHVYENTETVPKLRLPLLLNNSVQFKKMQEFEGMKRAEENEIFHICTDSPFDEEIFQINAKALKIQICTQYMQFQAKLTQIVKEQEKWKDLAKKISEEFQKDRLFKEKLKTKDIEIVGMSQEGIFTDAAALEREPLVKTVRNIDQNLEKLSTYSKETGVREKIQTVLDAKKDRKKLVLETPNSKDFKFIDLSEVLNNGINITKNALEEQKLQKDSISQLKKVKETLSGYLEICKKQREALKSNLIKINLN